MIFHWSKDTAANHRIDFLQFSNNVCLKWSCFTTGKCIGKGIGFPNSIIQNEWQNRDSKCSCYARSIVVSRLFWRLLTTFLYVICIYENAYHYKFPHDSKQNGPNLPCKLWGVVWSVKVIILCLSETFWQIRNTFEMSDFLKSVCTYSMTETFDV